MAARLRGFRAFLAASGRSSSRSASPIRHLAVRLSMESSRYDVALMTTDAALEAAVRQFQPSERRVAVVAPGVRTVTAAEWWVDLDAADASLEGPTRFCFVREFEPVLARPNVTYLNKPLSAADAARLWAPADGKPACDPDPLPGWIADYQDLDLRSLCHKMVTRLPARLGYSNAAVYLFDPTRTRLCLTDATNRHLADYELNGSGDCPVSWVARQARFILGESAREACRRLGLRPPATTQDGAILIAPLAAGGESFGTVLFSHRVASEVTELGLRLGGLFSFIGQAVQHARSYELARVEARIDALTGLYNYRWLIENLEREIRRAERFGEPLSVALVDLDAMKLVNDRFGHQAGDGLLRQVAERIRAVMRQTDAAARIGGDEFVLLLPGADANGAEQVERRLLREIAGIEIDPTRLVAARASIGLVEWRSGWTVGQLLDAADRAMYAVKYRNRGPALEEGAESGGPHGVSITAPAA